MIHRFKWAALALVLAASFGSRASAQTEQWHSLGGGSNVQIYIQQNSIVRKGDMASFWTLYQPPKPVPLGQGQVMGYVVNFQEVDCVKQQMRQISAQPYHEDGTPMPPVGATEFKPIVPRSNAAALMNAACSGSYANSIILRSVAEALSYGRGVFAQMPQ